VRLLSSRFSAETVRETLVPLHSAEVIDNTKTPTPYIGWVTLVALGHCLSMTFRVGMESLWFGVGCVGISVVISRLECTRVHIIQVSVLVSRPEVQGLGVGLET